MNRRRILLRALGGSAIAGTFAGCATAPPSTDAAEASARLPLWPAPPELPRYAYEATLRDSRSLQVGSDVASMRRLLTGDESRVGFGKAMGVAATGGRVYVTDTEGRRVVVFDLPRRRVFAFGMRLEGELKKPAGIDVDAAGRVYVVDSSARRVVIYDALGLYLGQIDGAAHWVRPTALAVSPDGRRVHVVDTGGVASASHRVYVHDADGRLLNVIGRRGERPGEFNLPADAALGRDGVLWVLDAGNFRVQSFDAEGRPLFQFGSVGNGLGQFARPRGLALDRAGLLYVADALLCNVQVFQPDGQLLLAIGSRARNDAPGHYLLPARLACDETGRLYVVDQYLHKVEVIRRLDTTEGERLRSMPSA
jgi:DNA-binding beta-propeller fold protein YncE